MVSTRAIPSEVPVLIVGGGPVGLALAADLGWRGVECLVVEKDGPMTDHPRANAQNARTMEFFRRWGIADAVREAGTPPDFPHTALYLTSLTGYEIARFDRPQHGGIGSLPFSPERPQRCNQLRLDPILRDLAGSFDSVTIRHHCAFEQHETAADGVIASVRDLTTGRLHAVRAQYVVACCGGRSSIRRTVGINLGGEPTMDYNLNFLLRIPDLWSWHDKGKAALHFLIGNEGQWAALVELDGRELWRFTVNGEQYYRAGEKLEVGPLLERAIGRRVPYELLSIRPWIARSLVAERYGDGRVFLAGDAAHQNPPNGGFGLNTGIGDAVDLGWKLNAVISGWGGPELLASYERERRPIALRNVGLAAESLRIDHLIPKRRDIAEPTEAGRAARLAVGNMIADSKRSMLFTDGVALGYRYDGSSIIWPDETPAQDDAIMQYRPEACPGARAPHSWLSAGCSTLDLFGRGFTVLAFGQAAREAMLLQEIFAYRGIPISVRQIDDPAVRDLYGRDLVLVRPDGHVAWAGQKLQVDPVLLADLVRGANSEAVTERSAAM